MRSKLRCGKLSQFRGDAVAALRITLIANAFLEAESIASPAISSGFARGIRKSAPPNEAKEKIPTDDVKTAEEVSMAVTDYVALPFIRTEDGAAPGEAQECQSAFWWRGIAQRILPDELTFMILRSTPCMRLRITAN
jgi:hypothetical protein